MRRTAVPLICWLLIALVFFGFSVPAFAAKRVALVIGNSTYTHTTKLKNPKNDATAISSVLKKLGFTVITGIDVNRRQLMAKARNFAVTAKGADVALFYYAGHGLQVHGKNYLAPIDAKLRDESDLDFETVPLQLILKNMERERRTNLVFLDACRDNPLAQNLARGMGTRSVGIGRGLARVESGIGTLIAFATQPGNVALDGEGENSPFTDALLKHIETPNLDIALLMRCVRQDVMDKTKERQVPWNNSSLTGTFSFLEDGTGKPPDATGPSSSELAFLKRELDALKKRLDGDKPGSNIKPGKEDKVAIGIYPKQPQTLARKLAPGDAFQDCDTCPKMMVIPQGNFLMGASKYDKGRKKAELPQHKVTFTNPFAAGKFEVTFGEFMAFARETGHKKGHSCDTYENRLTQKRTGRSWENPGFRQSDRKPVVCVNWQDIQTYLAWLKKTTGKPYRLLSEAEWEYSARAGMTHAYHFGNDVRKICKYANAADASQKESWRLKSCNDGSGEGVTPVGTYLPNGFGLHDMHGNVWEYVADCWAANYRGASKDGSARTTLQPGCHSGIFTKRSGSWANPVAALRSAYRQLTGDDPVYNMGFRVARDLEPSELR